jgi:hypothetical protein
MYIYIYIYVYICIFIYVYIGGVGRQCDGGEFESITEDLIPLREWTTGGGG